MEFAPECDPTPRLIRNSELGKYLGDGDCLALTTVMEVRQLEDGEVLVKEGDEDSTLFILIKGSVAVCNTVNGKEVTVNTMKPGDCAGIRSFVERTPRLVTLRAKGPATVYTIRPDDFELLLQTHPRQVYHFMRGLFRMLNINMERMHEKIRKLTK
ncbi:MAG: cyclic nucleotide-binding domain-containing protein [Rhodocyclaceae bacterium]|nr:cyclic nucleotide-binding domain-containing protein [Rhodocyclaceae bacterium]